MVLSRHAIAYVSCPVQVPISVMIKSSFASRVILPIRASTRRPFRSTRRFFAAPPRPPPGSQSRGRFENLNKRLPRFLQRYTTPLLNAPVTQITSFLILHEITAVVPLFGLAGAFHYGEWIPSLNNQGDGNNAFDEGVKKFGRWLRKKGWVEGDITEETTVGSITQSSGPNGSDANSQRGMRLVLEFATAYAITKALLPARIVLSVWATPWFARRVLGPVGRGLRRTFGTSQKNTTR